MVTHPQNYPIDLISPPCEENFEMLKIIHQRMPYNQVESTFEGKEDPGEGCSPTNEFDGYDS